MALAVLKELVLTGRVVTADAAFCHQDVCQTIVERGEHYVLPVKDNQPQLVAAISSEFTVQNAAFPPMPNANARLSGRGDHPHQGARSSGKTDTDQHDGTEHVPATHARLAQRETGLSSDPRMRLDRPRGGRTKDLARNRLRHHQPVARPGERGPSAATQPSALDD